MKGFMHSFESFGTVDGPGIRCVIFLDGCPLRCMYCHNPDTWNMKGQEVEAEELIQKVKRYSKFVKDSGGITVSGGEPLMQIEFLTELFKLAKKENISTAIDTSGYYDISDETKKEKLDELLKYTDMILLDIKHIDTKMHEKITGKPNEIILRFANYVSNEKNIKLWIRHVVVPGLTDDLKYTAKLKEFIDTLKTVKKVEVLPYHKFGEYKWEELGLDYKLKDTKVPDEKLIGEITKLLNAKINENINYTKM